MERIQNRKGRPIDRQKSKPRTRLEALLWQRGLTGYQVHKMLTDAGGEIAQSMVVRHVAGQRKINLHHALMYARALGIQVEDLASDV